VNDREPLIGVATICILLLIWLGGMISPSHHFAGTPLGGALAVTGSLLFMSPLLYVAVKRIPALKAWVTHHIPMRKVLVWHIYAGYLGMILVLLHSGHKFNSVLAASLLGTALLVVLSGIVGRYLQKQIGDDVRSKRKVLNQLYDEYDGVSALQTNSADHAGVTFGRYKRVRALLVEGGTPQETGPNTIGAYTLARIVNLVGSISDIESSIASRESLKQWFTWWYRVHFVLAIFMYSFLILHIWSGIHFGLRWFS
jgi:hypothetical protein